MVARRRGARKSANNGSSIRPAEAEICAAVESLYADELKPVGRLLRRRLHERAVADMRVGDADSSVLAVSEVDVEYIRSVCDNCPMINVEPEEGGDWSALLIGWPAAFVELCGPDVYPSGFWDALAAELQTLDATGSLEISGGRYACALALFSHGLPSLAGCSLGCVSHIVQLAITEKRLLGYRGGEIVLYDRSSSKAKEQRAVSQEASSSLGQGISELPVATWELARSCLQSILLHSSSHGAPGAVALSRVKCLFRCHCSVELSETRLGYSKLSELLQAEHFSDICSVQLEDSGYCVYQREMRVLPDLVETSMSGKHGNHRTDDNSTLQPVVHRPDEPLPLVAVSFPSPEIDMPHVKNTFIHFASPASPSTGTARRRASSVPRSLACSLDLHVGARGGQTPPSTCLPFSPALTASPQSVSQNVYWPDVDLRQGCIDSSAAIYFQSRALVVPEMAWWCAHECESGTSSVSAERDCHRQKFCVDEPLELEDVGLTPEVPRQVSLDINIKNTFVHASTSHTTPSRAPARRRARSVPKDMGSSDAIERGCVIDAISSCSEEMQFWGPSPSNCFGPPSPVVNKFLQQPLSALVPTFGQAQMLSECQTERHLGEFSQMALQFSGYADLMCSTADCSCDSAEEFTDANSTASSQTCRQTSDSNRETVFLSLVEALGTDETEVHAHSTRDLDEGSISSLVGERDSTYCTAARRASRWCDEKDDDDGVEDARFEMLSEESCQHKYTSVSSRKKRQQRRRRAYHCTSVGNSK